MRSFPTRAPAPLTRGPAPAPPATDPLSERLAIEGWTFTRLAIGGTLSFAVSASATVILLYFLLATERWLVERTAAAIRAPRTRALVLAGDAPGAARHRPLHQHDEPVNIALGIATGLALWAIGLPNPVLWGTTTAVLAFIPYLGPLLIAVLLLLAGSVTFGTGRGDARAAGRVPAAARRSRPTSSAR